MSVYFINCRWPSVEYLRGQTLFNDPVNIALCKSISRSKFAWYPDNTGLPSIAFHGCDAEWVFESETHRESEFARISQIQSGRSSYYGSDDQMKKRGFECL